MKNRIQIVLSVFVAFVICIATVNMSYASTRTDQKNATKAYYSFVKNKKGCYKIVDINGDKIKELLWMDRNNGDYEGNYKIYTYKNDKLKILKKKNYGKGGDIFYNAKTHKVAMLVGHSGGRDTYIYSVKNTSLKLIKIYSFSHTYKGSFYTINNKRVSGSTYNASLKSYIRGWGAVQGGITPYYY